MQDVWLDLECDDGHSRQSIEREGLRGGMRSIGVLSSLKSVKP